MKKLCLIFALIVLSLGSCGSNGVVDNTNKVRKFSHLEKNNLKNISKNTSKKRTPPTETMQIGLKKQSKNNQPDIEDRKKSFIDDAKSDYEQDIADSFIADDGTYIGKYKIGNQYEVGGVQYSPKQYDNFEEVGIASWYGDDFHGKKTANGEVYHKGDMTAAHPTLPLPSMARITNLDNGKSVKVRINDRGPFSKKRITDVSEKAAIELGFKNIGTAKVKLEYLKEDTEEMLQRLGISQ